MTMSVSFVERDDDFNGTNFGWLDKTFQMMEDQNNISASASTSAPLQTSHHKRHCVSGLCSVCNTSLGSLICDEKHKTLCSGWTAYMNRETGLVYCVNDDTYELSW